MTQQGFQLYDRVVRPSQVIVSMKFSETDRQEAMPTYDYVCDACQHEFELFQSIKDEREAEVPEVRPVRSSAG